MIEKDKHTTFKYLPNISVEKAKEMLFKVEKAQSEERNPARWIALSSIKSELKNKIKMERE